MGFNDVGSIVGRPILGWPDGKTGKEKGVDVKL